MAAQISHIIAGEAALESALSAVALSPAGFAGPSGASGFSEPSEEAAAFDFGCQGPDIFYHNRRTMPSGLHYGALAHRRRYGSIVAGAAAALPEPDRVPDSPRAAYVLGLATHAALDRAVHPFVIYFAGWSRPADPSTARFRGCHPFLERLLDLGLLESRLGIKARDFGLTARLGPTAAGSAPPTDAEAATRGDDGLVALWSAGLRSAYPSATAKDASLELRIANAISDARHFYAMTDPIATSYAGRGGSRFRETTFGEWLRRLGKEEGRRLVSIIYPEAIPEGLDPMNLRRAEWEHPSGDGRRSRATYLELIEEGTSAAARAIGLVLGFWRGELSAADLARELGEGGLALCDSSGATLPPAISGPLPLSEAMDAEYDAHVDLSASTG